MEQTLFISDLDGTLLDSDARISERSRVLLNGLLDRGLRFSFATARSHTSSMSKVTGLALREPVLAFNGALMISPDGREVYHAAALRYPEIQDAMEALMSEGYYPMVHTLTAGRSRVAWMAGRESAGMRRYLADRRDDKRMHAVESVADLFAGDILNLSLLGEQEWVARAQRMLSGHPLLSMCLQVDTYYAQTYWLEMQHPDATKAKGIRRLQQRLGLSRVICFGDNRNDLSMFRAADACYAVANAVLELKEIATGVIGSHTEDGVARFLQEWYDASEKPWHGRGFA